MKSPPKRSHLHKHLNKKQNKQGHVFLTVSSVLKARKRQDGWSRLWGLSWAGTPGALLGWGRWLLPPPPPPAPLRLLPALGAQSRGVSGPRPEPRSRGQGQAPRAAGAGAQGPKERQEEAPRAAGTGGGGGSRALTAESRMSTAPASLRAPGDPAAPRSRPRKGRTPAPETHGRAASRGQGAGNASRIFLCSLYFGD